METHRDGAESEKQYLLSVNAQPDAGGEPIVVATPPTKFQIVVKWVKDRLTWANFVVSLYVVGLTISSALNSVFIVQMSHSLQNYSYFCSEMPIVAYLIVFFPIVWYKQWFTKDIPDEVQTLRGKRWIVAMALFDQLADILMIYGAAGTKGPLVPIFTQSVVPLTMIASIIVFRRRYWITHYIGGVIVIGGVVSSALTQPDVGTNTVLGNILLILAGVPAAIAAILKELSFKRQSMDLYYLNAWESLFQFVFSIILTPVMSFIPPSIPLSQIPYNIWYGMRCMAGYNSLPGDDCSNAWLQVLLFVLFDIIFNIFLLLVVKYGSAALMFACNTISLPLSDIMFTMPWIVGAAAMPLNKFDLIGLAAIVVGLVVYRVKDEETGGVVVMGGAATAMAFPNAVVQTVEVRAPTRDERRGAYLSRLRIAPKTPTKGDEPMPEA